MYIHRKKFVTFYRHALTVKYYRNIIFEDEGIALDQPILSVPIICRYPLIAAFLFLGPVFLVALYEAADDCPGGLCTDLSLVNVE